MREYRKKNPAYRQREKNYEREYKKRRRETDEVFRKREKEYQREYQKKYSSEYSKTHRVEATERQKKWLMTPAGMAYKEAYKIRRRELAALKRAAKLKDANDKGKDDQPSGDDEDADDNLK